MLARMKHSSLPSSPRRLALLSPFPGGPFYLSGVRTQQRAKLQWKEPTLRASMRPVNCQKPRTSFIGLERSFVLPSLSFCRPLLPSLVLPLSSLSRFAALFFPLSLCLSLSLFSPPPPVHRSSHPRKPTRATGPHWTGSQQLFERRLLLFRPSLLPAPRLLGLGRRLVEAGPLLLLPAGPQPPLRPRARQHPRKRPPRHGQALAEPPRPLVRALLQRVPRGLEDDFRHEKGHAVHLPGHRHGRVGVGADQHALPGRQGRDVPLRAVLAPVDW